MEKTRVDMISKRKGKGKGANDDTKLAGELTFDVTSYVRVWSLVFVDNLNHAQQILLLELLQGLCNLLIVVLLGALLGRKSLLLGPVVFIGGKGTRFTQPLL